jgi:hypothetical protein
MIWHKHDLCDLSVNGMDMEVDIVPAIELRNQTFKIFLFDLHEGAILVLILLVSSYMLSYSSYILKGIW